MSTATHKPIWRSGPAARLLSRPCGNWRVPHGIGVPGHIAYVPYRVLPRVSVMDGYCAKAQGDNLAIFPDGQQPNPLQKLMGYTVEGTN